MMYIILIIVVVLAIIYISIYNGLQRAKVNTEESWSQIDVQLKRRNDLIPNLLETVKGYAKHEQETFSKVVELRNQLTSGSNSRQETIDVSNQLTDSLKSVFALAEAYPDLKANQNFLSLQEELANTENKIAYSRQLYNSTVRVYNQKLLVFPSNIIAGIHHFTKMEFLAIPEAEKEVPKVKF
ncbi:MAG: LemA family protein [Lactobacillus sp.]|nr:LemA family protein [Lactobacillus sp.]